MNSERKPHAQSLALSANSLRDADFRTRVDAASKAGFHGIGLRVGDYFAGLDQGLTDRDMRTILDDAGLKVFEIEAEWDWTIPYGVAERALSDLLTDHLAEVFNYRCLNAFIFPAHDNAKLVEGYGLLCDKAANAGLIVGLEFLPYSGIANLGAAESIVTSANRDNGGLIIDVWHLFRSGGTAEDLRSIPGNLVVSIQLNDVLPDPMPDPAEEARHHRQVPGAGTGNLTGLLEVMRATGVEAPIAVEVVSDSLELTHPADARAQLLFDAAVSTLSAAQWAVAPAPAPRTSAFRARAGHP